MFNKSKFLKICILVSVFIIAVSFFVPASVNAQFTPDQFNRLGEFENKKFIEGEFETGPFWGRFSIGDDDPKYFSRHNITVEPVENFLSILINIIYYIIPILIATALVLFLYGLLKYVKASDTKTKDDAKKFIAYGIVALFIMVSFWGFVNAISSTLGVRGDSGLRLEKNYGILP